MRKNSTPPCDKDCFNCQFPDCIYNGDTSGECLDIERAINGKKEEIVRTGTGRKHVSDTYSAKYGQSYYQKNRQRLLNKSKLRYIEKTAKEAATSKAANTNV